MKIGVLIHAYPPYHLAGAELMAHSILRWLAERGHAVQVVINQGTGYQRLGIAPYRHQGVRVSEEPCDLAGSDVLITHLDRTHTSEVIADLFGVPLVHVLHNHRTLAANNVRTAALVVYNTHWLAKAVPVQWPSVVVHPPVWPEDYAVPGPGDHITLINLQPAKGVGVFYGLARLLPNERFLGVTGGYGPQQVRSLPNVTILPPQADMREVYRRTKVLLMPSTYESYGRCAVEAAVSGIPTLCSRTPGLVEALGDSGTYIARPDVRQYAAAITGTDWAARGAAAKAHAAALDPVGELEALEVALVQAAATGRALRL